MQAVSEIASPITARRAKTLPVCYHCGTQCLTDKIAIADKYFCCDGCKLVYEIINEGGLCNYYELQSHPGLSQIKAVRNDKYAFLDNKDIAAKLYQFNNGNLAIVTLYLPSIHCSSCLWLLEHLDRLDAGVTESRVNFTAKEITIHFSQEKTTLRKVVELLTTIGYEPYISLENAAAKPKSSLDRRRVIRLGIAGFCFGNIMMMSFPEYLSGNAGIGAQYTHLFRYLNLVLSLPVFFYSAAEFYSAAWAGLKQKILNIDAPIVLALIITFSRSVYEILTGTGAGYLDSMSGIVFFMLAGRVLQERTYKSLSFTRDYKAYFPLAVNVCTDGGVVSKQLQDLKQNDILVLHHEEIIPADGLVLNHNALIDYSFVTGEAEPVKVKQHEMVYAGGKQKGEELMIQIVKPIAASYLTSLWNHHAFKKNKTEANDKQSIIHVLSKYFTAILLGLASLTVLYWAFNDPSRIITSVSAMLIVACPCALLLAATFTNSNILRIFGLNGFFLRDATVIEEVASADHIVFDKTGTITGQNDVSISVTGHELTDDEKTLVHSVARQSNHPNSVALTRWLGAREAMELDAWKELPGKGLEAKAGDVTVKIGSRQFVNAPAAIADKATFFVRIGEALTAFYVQPGLRPRMPQVLQALGGRYRMSLLSGDNDKQRPVLEKLFSRNSKLLFEQQPVDKLTYIEQLQQRGDRVIMIGDGLNDAGALQQSNVGITLAEDVNNFTPACDAILNAAEMPQLPALLQLARYSAVVIRASFVVSILYNMVGLAIAMQGLMEPVTAAILMPCSTLSIVIISSGLSNLYAWRKGLRVHNI